MALFIQSNNPATTCPEQALVRRGLAREDLFTVVHDVPERDGALCGPGAAGVYVL